MLSVLLMMLKVLGIIILILLGTILTLVLLVLFVPVRYRIMVHRKTQEEVPMSVKLTASWLLHILNAAFSYPEAAFLRVRIFCFTIFRSDKAQGEASAKRDEKQGKASRKKEPQKKLQVEKMSRVKPLPKELVHDKESCRQAEAENETVGQKRHDGNQKQAAKSETQKTDSQEETGNGNGKNTHTSKKKGIISKFLEFIRKLWAAIKNIKYTILKICDKIKHIVKNIQYYRKIIQSDTFKRAWAVCSGQVFSLLKSISPRKIQGNLLIGTGDPASTGQVLAIYGMLYPLLGNHIDIVPDFERQIIEGDLYVKGRITVFKALKTAWIVYFNKDLRRLIKLFKREAA